MRWSVGTFRFSPPYGWLIASIRALDPREKLAVLVVLIFPVPRPFVLNPLAPILQHFSSAACRTLRQKEFTQHEFS